MSNAERKFVSPFERIIGASYRFDYPTWFVSLPDYTARRGQMVTVVRQFNDDEAEPPNEDCPDVLYKVRGKDGWDGEAWGSELSDPQDPPAYG